MAGQLILGLSLLVGLHELGHLLAAKAFGMRVEQYFIGFPPKLWSMRRGETEYGIGAIPMGGYVKIAGMVDESLDTAQLAGPPKPYEFRAKPAWQRLIVMLGGIIVNVLAGILIFVVMAYKNGHTYLAVQDVKYGIVASELAKSIGLQTGDKIIKVNNRIITDFSDVRGSDVLLGNNATYTVERNGQQIVIPIPNDLAEKLTDKKIDEPFIEPIQPFLVGELAPNMPAIRAGIQPGDSIVAANGTPIRFYHEFRQVVKPLKNKPLTLNISRKGQPLTLQMTTSPDGTIGLYPKTLLHFTTEHYTLGEAIRVGTKRAFQVVFDNIKGFGKIFRGEVSASKALSGPIGIAQNLFGGVWDWNRFWSVTGLLSMALAFMNILPIPALDGGHAAILSYEMISGRKPSDRFLEISQRIGMVILLGLMVFAVFNDVFKAFF